ncbi:MAG TPA: hypothetical protein VN131_04490 [Mobilitalea sp.]|nr:hypothetical protein [Mobilitalea sp.]
MKVKIKKSIKKMLLLLFYSLILFGLGYALALFISYRFNYTMQDVLSYEGIIILIIGVLMSMKGNPSGVSMRGIGQNNVNAVTYDNLETTRIERDITDYHKNFMKHSVVEFAFSNITVILGGIFIILFTLLFYY